VSTIKAKPKGNVRVADSYFQQVKAFPLVSIKSDSHLRAAQQVLDGLLKKGALDSGEEEYLEVLSDLVAAYEARHFPIPPATDAELLRHLMEARKVTQAVVAEATGIARSTISEILSGKRLFSKRHIGVLAEFFHVPPQVFLSNL